MPDFRRKNIRLKDFDYKNGYAYFITICSNDRYPYFKDFNFAKFIESTINFRILNDKVTVFCYCIMPDHIHILMALHEDYNKDLSTWVSSFKRYISKEGKERYNFRNTWQKSFNDHVVRSDESLYNIAGYILNNPVRKNMVSEWTQYPFSKIKV